MSKNPTQAKSILPLVYTAVSKRKLYPSKAEDSGSSKRNATYLTQIVLNLLNGGDECSDQMAASAVYNLPSFISSHSFVNLYAVDFINYVKSGGKSLREDVNILDEEDFDSDSDSEPLREKDHLDVDTGYGQGARPTSEKLCEDEGGGVRVSIVRDIDDYLNMGEELKRLTPYMGPYIYKSLIRRVSKKQIEKLSKEAVHAGAQKSRTFDFSPDHPLSHSHVQRLNKKPLIVKLVGRGMPKDPGPWSGPRTGKEFATWYRKQRKLTDYIQAIFLPFDKSVSGMRKPEDIEEELRTLKKTYVGQHLLRTIHNGLTVPNVTFDQRKGIQLLRHVKSRKRSSLFQDKDEEKKQSFGREEEAVSDILCAAQMKDLLGEKSNTRMDCHLKDVRTQQKKLFGMMEDSFSKVHPRPESNFTVSSARKLLADIKQNVAELEKKLSKAVRRSNSDLRKSFEVEEDNFFKGLLPDQRIAGDYFLSKIRTLGNADQLLMLLHGQPGSGKSFFIERIRDYTNLRMKICASSGIAGMSLGGSTLDWLMGFGYSSNSRVDIETLRKRFTGVELLIIDEISMIGCKKLLKVDTVLKRVFNDTRPFGGLHVLLVGDFAQIPAIKQIPIINTMVNSTKIYVDHSDLEIQIEALFGSFKKYELRGLRRSKDCKKLKNLLKKFRDYDKLGPTLSEDDLTDIGILNREVLINDPKFREAPILVTTRKERDAINKRSGREWARKNGVPMYWWYQRALRDTEDTIEADHYAHSMSKFCCGVRAYYIPGVKCMLKANTLPQAGYANGSQGRMIGVVHEDTKYVLPTGYPGEMIMIPPPMYIIMEVHHIGKGKKTSILPCIKQKTVLEYYRNSKPFGYGCWSNMVVLTFALIIHEMKGQTLRRIILLLGRMPGMNVGKTTWNLLYVALSRTKRLSHVKFFPTGSTKYYHSMYFSHLLKLSMPTTLKRWLRSYVDHCWDRNILRLEHLQSVRKVEKKLKLLGKDKTMKLKWVELHSLVKQMGRKATTRDNKMILFCILKEHMVKRLLWNTSKDSKPAKRKGNQRRKRPSQEVRVERSEESNSSLRRSKRLKGSRESNEDHGQRRRSTRILSSRKRRSDLVDLPSRTQKKQHPRKKRLGRLKVQKSNIRNREHKIVDPNNVSDFPHLVSQESNTLRTKGLSNLGNSCYYNSVVQCLYGCPTFREAIETVAPEGLRVVVIKQLQILFKDMGAVSDFPYLAPTDCLAAAMNIPECKNAGMKVNGRQHDASEFLDHLLEHLKKKCRPLSEIYEGQFVYSHTCQHCFYCFNKNEPFKLYTLQMDLPSTHDIQTFDLYTLMDHFHRATIQYGYSCRQCGYLNSTKKTISLIALPRVLVIHLSRFQGLQKIDKHVRFTAQTSIRYNIDGNDYNNQYRIMGIVVHIGPTILGGHYVAYIRAGQNWFRMNDHIVTAVRWSEVRKQKAYLLFFEQI